MPQFKAINFGYSSAEAERSMSPELVENGFLDYNSSLEKIMEGNYFLVLGYKGSGKSMIGSKICSMSEKDPKIFAECIHVEDLPYKRLPKIIRGDIETQNKLPKAWGWIFLIYIVHSLYKDEGFAHEEKGHLSKIMKDFHKIGLGISEGIGSIIIKSTKRSFMMGLSGFSVGFGGEEKTDVADYTEYLKRYISRGKTNSRHFIIIDGLDDIIINNKRQMQAISSLIFEAERLNRFFARAEIFIKIIILLRSDLFGIIPGSNKNKLRQDQSIELNWYEDISDPSNANLIHIANLRAKISLKKESYIYVIEEFFAQRIKNINTHKYLLNLTRHTPRDFLSLMKYIQKSTFQDYIDYREVINGERRYSNEYFIEEVYDEADGFIDKAYLKNVFSAISSLGRAEFILDDIKRHPGVDGGDLEGCMRKLYDMSAIGNINKVKGNNYYYYKYRNLHTDFNKNNKIIVHNGLRKALNIA